MLKLITGHRDRCVCVEKVGWQKCNLSWGTQPIKSDLKGRDPKHWGFTLPPWCSILSGLPLVKSNWQRDSTRGNKRPSTLFTQNCAETNMSALAITCIISYFLTFFFSRVYCSIIYIHKIHPFKVNSLISFDKCRKHVAFTTIKI